MTRADMILRVGRRAVAINSGKVTNLDEFGFAPWHAEGEREWERHTAHMRKGGPRRMTSSHDECSSMQREK